MSLLCGTVVRVTWGPDFWHRAVRMVPVLTTLSPQALHVCSKMPQLRACAIDSAGAVRVRSTPRHSASTGRLGCLPGRAGRSWTPTSRRRGHCLLGGHPTVHVRRGKPPNILGQVCMTWQSLVTHKPFLSGLSRDLITYGPPSCSRSRDWFIVFTSESREASGFRAGPVCQK